MKMDSFVFQKGTNYLHVEDGCPHMDSSTEATYKIQELRADHLIFLNRGPWSLDLCLLWISFLGPIFQI